MSCGIGGHQSAKEMWEKEGIPGGGNCMSKTQGNKAHLGVGQDYKSFSR